MSAKTTDTGTKLSVVAITQQENQLKAVKLEKRGPAFELLWTKSSEVGRVSLPTFAARCDLAARPEIETDARKNRMTVVGFDSAGVVFYRIGVPAVKKDELAAIVKLQAESRLPLPTQQIELSWRADKVQDGQVMVTVAGAKADQLRKFVENVRDFDPAKILLGAEGIVKAWRMLFSGHDDLAVVVSPGRRCTQICLAEHGRLVNAVSLDVGTEDFAESRSFVEETQAGERFAQDMGSVLEMFGFAGPAAAPMVVLSDGGNMVTRMVSCLQAAGLNASPALPQLEMLATPEGLAACDVYDYRVPIGLASMVLDGDTDELDVFGRLYKPAAERAKKHWFHSPRITAALAVAMLILLVAVFYAADVAADRRLGRLAATENFEHLIERANLIKTVARQRQKSDVLEFLSEINGVESKGILLNSVHIVKGRDVMEVRIEGQADKVEQLYEFEKGLEARKLIQNFTEESAVLDEKDKKTNFRVTFHYGGLVKASGVRGSEGRK